MLDIMLITILCNFNVESDNKHLFFFMHFFCYLFLSHLLLLLADNLFCVFLIAPSSFSSAWVAFIYFHPLCLICPSWFPSSFTTFVCNVFFSFVIFTVLCNFLPALCVYMNSGYFSVTFSSSFGIPVQMMTFQWYRLQYWKRRKKKKSDRSKKI